FFRPRSPRAPPSFPTRRSSDLRFRLVAGWELVISAPKYNCCGQAHRRGRSARIVIFQGQAYTSVSDTDLYRIATVEPKAARPCLLPSTPLARSEEHTSELQSRFDLVCRLLLEKKNRYV